MSPENTSEIHPGFAQAQQAIRYAHKNGSRLCLSRFARKSDRFACSFLLYKHGHLKATP